MDTCDVVIVGGGPAGSSCARALRRAGLDVVVVDRSPFPRDKVCAGWITPQVVDELEIDCNDYRRGRTFQPITGFRIGVIGGSRETATSYAGAVSFGIRRCEFDHYLLQRSGARLRLGVPVSSLQREGVHWVIDGCVKAPVLVGAGGHFCPVAARMNPSRAPEAPVVAAQEAEFPIERGDRESWTTAPEMPELYFCADLKGYGWCFRKGGYINVGFGRLDPPSLKLRRPPVASREGRPRSLPKASAHFADFLRARGKIPPEASWRWRGHAYLVSGPPRRRIVGDGVLLAGDAAGLAYPQSGEGIRPAIESGLLAASAIVAADGTFTRERLAVYEQQLRARFGLDPRPPLLSTLVPPSVASLALPWLLRSRLFTRRLLLDRWFLHRSEAPLQEQS